MAEIRQKIVPRRWFDKQASEAASFYCSVFPDSSITNVTTLCDTPSGDCDVVSFMLWGYSFLAISAGPMFRFNPSISFMVHFDPSRDTDAKARIDAAWAKLSEGGKVLMSLDRYPFSERYGGIQDKFGLSWQPILTNPEGEERPPVIPSLLFVGNVYGKAEAASDFYLSLFRNSRRGQIVRYPAGMEPDREGAVTGGDRVDPPGDSSSDPPGAQGVRRRIEAIWRLDAGRIVAALARWTGDFHRAEVEISDSG